MKIFVSKNSPEYLKFVEKKLLICKRIHIVSSKAEKQTFYVVVYLVSFSEDRI